MKRRFLVETVLLMCAFGSISYLVINYNRSSQTRLSPQEAKIAKLIEQLDGPGESELSVGDVPGWITYQDRVYKELLKFNRKATPQVIVALKDQNKWRRVWAVKFLGEVKDPRAIEPLIQSLDRRSFEVTFVPKILADFHDISALPALGRALDLPSWIVKGTSFSDGPGQNVALALAAFGEPARPILERNTHSTNEIRAQNARAGLDKLNGGTGIVKKKPFDYLNEP